jgi:predicted nucleic acid binding AN1-type Zn finger protein
LRRTPIGANAVRTRGGGGGGGGGDGDREVARGANRRRAAGSVVRAGDATTVGDYERSSTDVIFGGAGAALPGPRDLMELPELGEQCSFVGCGQLDFLPFNCDGCDRTFCLEHRTSHGCRAGGKRVRSLPSRYRSETTIPVTTTVTPAVAFLAGASFTSGLRPHSLSSSRPSLDPQDTTCVVCPLCGGGVKHVPGESVHVTYERHASGGSCDPSRHPLARSARRCPARGCGEKLNAVNAYTCRSCGSEVCLKHRHERLHDCEANKRARMMMMRCVLYTSPHTTPFAWWTPILKDFARRISPPTPRFQSPPSTPFNFN